MLNCYTTNHSEELIPILALTELELASKLTQLNAWQVNYLNSVAYQAKPGSLVYLPKPETGQLELVLFGVENIQDMWVWGGLPVLLPAGSYMIGNKLTSEQLQLAAIAWGLGAYQYTRYKKANLDKPKLFIASELNYQAIEHNVEAAYLARNLINTPAEDMGPAELAEAACQVASKLDAKVKIIRDTNELQQAYPAIYAVGKGSERKPCMVDMQWGNEQDPKVTLVGKGVCFDSGGLNIKTGQGMRLMKKDMGGAAHALALAQWLIQAKLPIRLRVLLPIVENSVSGNAFRPGDIIQTRKGLTVEIDNTDAEGRLILCDALTQAVEEQPELLIDFATLTGAARVALGPDMPALFANQDAIANQLLEYAQQEQDPIWRLPLYKPYREMLKSSLADLSNAANSPYAGAITAALFLQEFVPNQIPWLHFDLMAWNTATKPGRPEGGEAMTLRALFKYLAARYVK
ncbi:MAG: pepB [Gammaproteobacteria bacterium]|jgi:leucyl aminopeptidase|nr:pepB [Gammaproteobacteria bacterium]